MAAHTDTSESPRTECLWHCSNSSGGIQTVEPHHFNQVIYSAHGSIPAISFQQVTMTTVLIQQTHNNPAKHQRKANN